MFALESSARVREARCSYEAASLDVRMCLKDAYTRLPLKCGHARRQGRALRAVEVWFRITTSEQRVREHAALARLGGAVQLGWHPRLHES